MRTFCFVDEIEKRMRIFSSSTSRAMILRLNTDTNEYVSDGPPSFSLYFRIVQYIYILDCTVKADVYTRYTAGRFYTRWIWRWWYKSGRIVTLAFQSPSII